MVLFCFPKPKTGDNNEIEFVIALQVALTFQESVKVILHMHYSSLKKNIKVYQLIISQLYLSVLLFYKCITVIITVCNSSHLDPSLTVLFWFPKRLSHLTWSKLLSRWQLPGHFFNIPNLGLLVPFYS